MSQPVPLTPIDLQEYAIGAPVVSSGNADDETFLEGYISVTAEFNGEERVVAFGIAAVGRDNVSDSHWLVNKRTLTTTSFNDKSRLNATANLCAAWQEISTVPVPVREQIYALQSQLDEIASAPLLVRSRQIQEATP